MAAVLTHLFWQLGDQVEYTQPSKQPPSRNGPIVGTVMHKDVLAGRACEDVEIPGMIEAIVPEGRPNWEPDCAYRAPLCS
jgi:hypothetical protein